MTSSCRSTIKSHLKATIVVVAALGLFSSCITDTPKNEPMDEIVHGTIAYPFVDESKPLGKEQPDERFVIRSASGGAEYTIEIPGAARDYDVQVPLAEIGATDPTQANLGQPKDLANPVQTDKEMTSALPRLERDRATDTAIMDGAFGVGEGEGTRQAPSYTLGIARVNDLYKRRHYEYALIELNSMLAFYPNSAKLHKMKGTVLVKMRNLPLAELAWIKALELTPGDKALQGALEKLQQRIIVSGGKAQGVPLAKPYEIPKPVGTPEPKKEDALAH